MEEETQLLKQHLVTSCLADCVSFFRLNNKQKDSQTRVQGCEAAYD
jgi:hypothetical protein